MKFITLTDPLPYQACVATIGFFDGVHRGHRFLIRQLTRYAAGHDLASLLITFRTHPRQVMQAAYQPQLLTTYVGSGLLPDVGFHHGIGSFVSSSFYG